MTVVYRRAQTTEPRAANAIDALSILPACARGTVVLSIMPQATIWRIHVEAATRLADVLVRLWSSAFGPFGF